MRLLLIATLPLALELMACSERADCDRAIERICDDGAVDCKAKPPPIVDVMKRCDSDEIIGERHGHLAICIAESKAYPKILAALDKGDQALCSMRCDGACDLTDRCQAFQYASCFPAPPPADAGAPDAS